MKLAGEQRRPTPFEKLDWTALYQAVGLDLQKVDRLTRVLVVHLLADRLVTLLLAAKLAASSQSKERPDVEKAIRDLAPLSIPTRVNLAAVLGLLAPTAMESILEINRVRNSLVHFKPKAGKPAWDVGEVEEIASQMACDRCTQKGIEAVQALMSALSSHEARHLPDTVDPRGPKGK